HQVISCVAKSPAESQIVMENPILPLVASLQGHSVRLGDDLGPAEPKIWKEIAVRLERLSRQYEELRQINSKMMDLDPLAGQVSLDPETDTLICSRRGLDVSRVKLRQADPNTPVAINAQSAIGAYVAGETRPIDPDELPSLRARMEELIESFYQGAH